MPSGLTEALLRKGAAVLAVNHYSGVEVSDQFTNFFCTYNRTKLQNRVRDLVTVCAGANLIDPRGPSPFQVTLTGTGQAGVWALLAAPAADAVVADVARLDTTDEQGFLAANLFCPGLLTIGGPEGGAMLSAPHPLLLHNTGTKFATARVQATYKVADAAGKIRIASNRLSDREIAEWVMQ